MRAIADLLGAVEVAPGVAVWYDPGYYSEPPGVFRVLRGRSRGGDSSIVVQRLAIKGIV